MVSIIFEKTKWKQKNISANLVQNNNKDLAKVIRDFWQNRIIIAKTIGIFTVIGIVFALLARKEFTSSTVVVPQFSAQENKLGGLSSLASIAGFDINSVSSGQNLSPKLYPQILKSEAFQLELMHSTLELDTTNVSIYEYLRDIYEPSFLENVKTYTIGIPGLIIKQIRDGSESVREPESTSDIVSLTKQEDEVRKQLGEIISLNIDDRDGYINISSTLPNPIIAAQLTKITKNLLEKYVIQFKIGKEEEQLAFLQERLEEREKKYLLTQRALASYRDANQNIQTAKSKTEEELLLNEYNLAYDIYSQVANKVELSKINVKENTPAFYTIKPVHVPLEKSRPSRILILLAWVFFGVLISIFTINMKRYQVYLKSIVK